MTTNLDWLERLITKEPNEWTPSQLAKYIGVPLSQIFKMLDDNPHLKNYVKYKYKEKQVSKEEK